MQNLLQRPDVRLLTLLGAPGIGKTRLSLQVATDLLDTFEDGCCFVALAPVRTPDLVATTIARAVGVKEIASQPLVERLKHYLHSRHILLVLDNFEHALPAGALVAALLTAAPGLNVLVTSRAALHLSGEHAYMVPPLALPDCNLRRLLMPWRACGDRAVRPARVRGRAQLCPDQLKRTDCGRDLPAPGWAAPGD